MHVTWSSLESACPVISALQRRHWLHVGSLPPLLWLTVTFFGASGCGVNVGGTAPAVTVASVKDLGTIPTYSDILGRDGGYSAEFQGYSVWLYGDTFLAAPNAEDFSLIRDAKAG